MLRSRAGSTPSEILFLAVYLLAFAVIPRLYGRWRRRVSQSWPAAEAKIYRGVVRQEGKEQRWVVRLTYTFHTASGERYAGSAAKNVRGLTEGEAYLSRMENAKVLIRFNPRNPDDSIADLPPLAGLTIIAAGNS